MASPTIFVLATRTDRATGLELQALISQSQGPEASVRIVEWPTLELPWNTEDDSHIVVVPVSRNALASETAWQQTLTSRQIDTAQSIFVFLGGLAPETAPDLKLHKASTISAATVGDASQQIVGKISTLVSEAGRPRKRTRLGPDTNPLVGRGDELRQARDLAGPTTRSIAVVGLGGQGKTSFAALLADELEPRYAKSAWVSLRGAPTLDWVAQQLALQLGDEISVADATAQTASANIIRMLSDSEVLVFLDNAETVFSRESVGDLSVSEDLASHYEYLFRCLAEAKSSSLVIVTSRELPNAYRLFPSALRVFRLPGLDDAAVIELFKRNGVLIGADIVEKIQAKFLGNAFAVKLLCGLYLDRGDSLGSDLISSEDSLSDDIASLLDEHISRLSEAEHLLASKLAWQGGVIDAAHLRDLAWPIDAKAVQGHLQRLVRLLLVDDNGLTLTISHPLLREYLVDELKRDIRSVLLTKPGQSQLPSALSNVLFVNPFGHDHTQAEQIDAVTESVAEVGRQLGTKHKVRERLASLIEVARNSQGTGYAIANIVELLRRASLGLQEADLSGLSLEHVDFRGIDVRGVNCANAAFRSCVFGDNFGPVTAVTLLAGEPELLAVGTFEGFVRLWAPNGELCGKVQCADDWLSAITPVTQSGESFFAAVDGRVGAVQWKAQSLRIICEIDAQVRSLIVVDQMLVAACSDGTVRLISPSDGKEACVKVANFRLKVARLVPGLAEQTVLLAGDSGDLLFFDVGTRAVSCRMLNGSAWIRDAIFDSAGQSLFTADDDGRVRAWRKTNGTSFTLSAEAGHSHRVWCLALDERLSRLFSAGNDAVIRVWDADTLRQVDLFEGHGSWVRSMALMQDGAVLVSGGEDQTLRFWHTHSGVCFRRRTGYARRVFSIDFGSEDVLICGTADHKLVKFDLKAEQRPVTYLDGHRDQVFAVAVECRSGRVASVSDDGEVRVWDLATGETIYAERLHTGWIGAIAFSPTGLMLVSGADDRTMVAVDAVQLAVVGRKRTHEGRISSIRFASDDMVVCTSEDGSVRKIAVPSCEELLKVPIGAGPLFAIGLLPWANSALAAGVGGRVWRVPLEENSSPEVVAEFAVNAIWSIDVSSTARIAALGMDDGTVVLLDCETWGSKVLSDAHQRQVWSVRWSPSGETLATASEDGEVALWQRGGRLIRRLAPPMLFEGFVITGAEGLSPAERHHLLSMGALP